MKKMMTLLIFIQSIGFVFGQADNKNSVIFNHFALSVKDVDQSVEFYKNVLNLKEITNKTKKDGIRWMSLGEGKELHLISTLEGEIKTNKAVHLAITTSDFELVITQLQAMEIKYSNWPGKVNEISNRPDGIKQVYIQDPDGYWIEVNSVGEKTD